MNTTAVWRTGHNKHRSSSQCAKYYHKRHRLRVASLTAVSVCVSTVSIRTNSKLYLHWLGRIGNIKHHLAQHQNTMHSIKIYPCPIFQHLRSATQQLLVVPCHQLSSYGRRAFCVAGPSVWNSLPDSLRNPIIGGNSLRQSLKTFLFAMYWCIQRIRGFTTMHYINRPFTYLLDTHPCYAHVTSLLCGWGLDSSICTAY